MRSMSSAGEGVAHRVKHDKVTTPVTPFGKFDQVGADDIGYLGATCTSWNTRKCNRNTATINHNSYLKTVVDRLAVDINDALHVSDAVNQRRAVSIAVPMQVVAIQPLRRRRARRQAAGNQNPFHKYPSKRMSIAETLAQAIQSEVSE